MLKRNILTGVLAVALLIGSVSPVYAAGESQSKPVHSTSSNDITSNGGNSNVPISLTAEAATFNVTVPTSLPISVAADGTVTTSSNVKIVNNSAGRVRVTGLKITGVDAWEIVNYDNANMANEKVGSTKVAMEINGDKTTADDTITFTASNFPALNGKGATSGKELPITYHAKVPAQSSAKTDISVANVTFTIGWDI